MFQIKKNRKPKKHSIYLGELRLSPDIWIILGSLAQLERSMIQERVRAGMKNAKAKGKIIGRVRKRNSALIESLLEAGLSYREIARIAKCSHGSVHAQKKEFLARKSKEQQQKLDDLQKKITENKSESPIDAMNVSEDIIQQVQVKIETEARSKVHEITGGSGYETFD